MLGCKVDKIFLPWTHEAGTFGNYLLAGGPLVVVVVVWGVLDC